MAPHEMIPPSQPAAKAGGLGAALRWAGLLAVGAAGAVVVIALAVVATAAALIGLVVGAGVVLALRVTAKSRRKASTPSEPGVLEGRRTADGWVVEAASRH